MTSKHLKNEGSFDPTADTTSLDGLKSYKALNSLESIEQLTITHEEEVKGFKVLDHITFDGETCLTWDTSEVHLAHNNLVKVLEANLTLAALC
jgi:hypothetical protein